MKFVSLKFGTFAIQKILIIALLLFSFSDISSASDIDLLLAQTQQQYISICLENVIATLEWKDKQWLPGGRLAPKDGRIGDREFAIKKITEISDKKIWDLCQQEIKTIGKHKDNLETGIIYSCYYVHHISINWEPEERNTGMCRERWFLKNGNYNLVEVTCTEPAFLQHFNFEPTGEFFSANPAGIILSANYRISPWITAGECNLIEGNPSKPSI